MEPTSQCPYSGQQGCSQEKGDAPITYDYYLYTDGSGLAAGAGAYAAIILSTEHPEISYTSVVGGAANLSTTRSEMYAVIEGVARIYSERRSHLKKGKKETILVVTDRQDIAGVLNKLFTSAKNEDLWARLSWYTQFFDIEAKQVKRETNITQSLTDKLASGFRLVVKEYIEAQVAVNHIAKT